MKKIKSDRFETQKLSKKNYLQKNLTFFFLNHFQTRDNFNFAQALQQMQYLLQCCGWKGPDDYIGLYPDQSATSDRIDAGTYPRSCCGAEVNFSDPQTSIATCVKEDLVFYYGCVESPVIEKWTGWASTAGGIVVMFQIATAVAAGALSYI